MRQLLFRVWEDRPDASAEIYKGGDWVWTPIPSGAVAEHPLAEQLTEEEAERLEAPDGSVPAGVSGSRPIPRGIRP